MKKSLEKVENSDMLCRLAWSFHYTTGIEWDELFCEAALAYYEARADFDPNNGAKLSTYAYGRVKNHLIDFCRKEQQSQYTSLDSVAVRDTDIDNEALTTSTSQCAELNQFIISPESDFNLNDLFPGGKCREIVDMLIGIANTPAEFMFRTVSPCSRVEVNPTPIDFNLPPKIVRGQIVRELRERGWTHSAIWETMSEIKFVINSN